MQFVFKRYEKKYLLTKEQYNNVKSAIAQRMALDKGDSGIYDEEFEKYTTKHSLERVRTTNMGSLYELKYYVVLKDNEKEKEFIDALRCKNGNLPIVCGRIPENDSLL